MGNSLNLLLSPKPKCSCGGHFDPISSLPDDVLLSILSFLPIKEVLMTNILSKRWRNLWVHTLVLDFHVPILCARPLKTKWVDRVLDRHKGLYLKKFKVVCWLDEWPDKNRIENWLEFALSKKVEHLELDIWNPCLYRGYGSYDWDRFLEFDLKCLKSLSLKHLEVTSQAFNGFILNCHFLERLEVDGIAKVASLDISLPNSKLKYLTIKHNNNLKVLRISNFNLVSLDIQQVKVLTLTGLPMLIELSISKYVSCTRCSLSQATCYSQLESFTLLGLQLKEAVQLSNVDQMTKLKRLVIGVAVWSDEGLTILVSIIKSYPCLKEFVLMVHWYGPDLRKNIHEVKRGNTSLKSESLKVFEFVGYRDNVRDVEMIMHVVDNAVCLEKIIVDHRQSQLFAYSHNVGFGRDYEDGRLAMKQLKALQESGYIRPHVEVVIR